MTDQTEGFSAAKSLPTHRCRNGHGVYLVYPYRYLDVLPEHALVERRIPTAQMRALVRAGYTLQWIRKQIEGNNNLTVTDGKGRNYAYTVRTARRIMDLVLEVGHEPGPSEGSRHRGILNGWPEIRHFLPRDFDADDMLVARRSRRYSSLVVPPEQIMAAVLESQDRNGRDSIDDDEPTATLIERLVRGERLVVTRQTRARVCQVWYEEYGSLAELRRISGWKTERYWRVNGGEVAA